MTKVSVVVPVYNVEQYLEKCLTSLVSQTLQEIEIIVVNDGSTDFSQTIIDRFAKEYPKKVRSLVKKNGGLSDARNYGLTYCRGEYIGFIDSDDYVDINMFAEMYTCAKKNNSDVVMCDYYKEYANHRDYISVMNVLNPREIYYHMLAAAWNKIYRRELLISSKATFPKNLYYEDTAFFSELLPSVKNINIINKPFVHYVQRNGSIANSQGEKTRQIFDIFDVIIEFYKENYIYEEYRYELEYLCAKVLLGSSLERISYICDKKLRIQYLEETLDYLNGHFEDWKSNHFLRRNMNARHIFMLCMNKITIRVASTLLRIRRNIHSSNIE